MFERLFNDIWVTINPNDVFEEHWVFEATHQIWEAFRYRRHAAQLFTSCKRSVIENLVRPIIDAADAGNPLGRSPWSDDTPERLAVRYMQREKTAIVAVDQMLHKAGIDQAVIEAEAAAMRSLELSRIAQLLSRAESRRNATLKAIERHRTGLGTQLRKAVEKFETDELEKPQTAETARKLAA